MWLYLSPALQFPEGERTACETQAMVAKTVYPVQAAVAVVVGEAVFALDWAKAMVMFEIWPRSAVFRLLSF